MSTWSVGKYGEGTWTHILLKKMWNGAATWEKFVRFLKVKHTHTYYMTKPFNSEICMQKKKKREKLKYTSIWSLINEFYNSFICNSHNSNVYQQWIDKQIMVFSHNGIPLSNKKKKKKKWATDICKLLQVKEARPEYKLYNSTYIQL